jgi:hypothetical protein
VPAPHRFDILFGEIVYLLSNLEQQQKDLENQRCHSNPIYSSESYPKSLESNQIEKFKHGHHKQQ